VHGADSSERTKCRRGRLLRDLHNLHALRSEVLLGDLIFFIAPTPADDAKIDLFVQSHGPAFIQNWINTYPLYFSRANVTRSRLPPEVHVRSLTTSTLFPRAIASILLHLVVTSSLFLSDAPLRLVSPSSVSHPSPLSCTSTSFLSERASVAPTLSFDLNLATISLVFFLNAPPVGSLSL
jgi:hypothetical protein